jgi:hypothetical protein
VKLETGTGIVTDLNVISRKFNSQVEFRHSSLTLNSIGITFRFLLSALRKWKHCAFFPGLIDVLFNYRGFLFK